MKKLLVKIKVIDIPYSPLIPAIHEKWIKDEVELLEQPMIEQVTQVPAKWTKDELEVFEQPMIEVDGALLPDESYTYHEASELKEMVNDESYTYHEGSLEVPEVLEESHEEVIAQTQGSDEELAEWLEGDKFKYPEGHWLEYVDITEQVEQDKVNAEALKYLASTDFMVLRHIRQKALGHNLSLSEEGYLTLELERANAASSVIR